MPKPISSGVRLPLRSRRARRLTIAGASWFLLLVLAQGLYAPGGPAARDEFPPRWDTHMDRMLGRVVDGLARKQDTVVWCWSVADWELGRDPWRGRKHRWKGLWGGYTIRGAVQLAPNECAVLKLLRTSPAPAREWTNPEGLAWSISLLAHESVHVAGYRSEKKATCWGLQRVAKTALALGRTADDARYLADLAWKHAYPRVPPAYRSPECRDGGRLDLRPKSHIWP